MTPGQRRAIVGVYVSIFSFSFAFNWLTTGSAFGDWIVTLLTIVITGGLVLDAALDYRQWKREHMTRPMFGKIIRRDGTVTKVIFLGTDEPGTFMAFNVHDGRPSSWYPDERLRVDRLAPGQSVVMNLLPDPGTRGS